MSAPVQFRTGQIWSLWEMLERHVHLFLEANTDLMDVKWQMFSFLEKATVPSVDEKKSMIIRLKSATVILSNAAKTSGFPTLLPKVERLAYSITEWSKADDAQLFAESLAQEVRQIIFSVSDELHGRYYYSLDGTRLSLFNIETDKWAKTFKKLPSAVEDIEEASKCLALGRNTAAMFHLMRAMEISVKRAGRKLGISNVDRDWGKILSDVGTKISEMPKSAPPEKRKRNKWSLAHANLYHVKEAWRNETMHPKQTYTEEQATEAYRAVCAFMNQLAALV